MSKAPPPTRAEYKIFYPITTRWSDNDIYGHVNNVVYYAYFDVGTSLGIVPCGKGLDSVVVPLGWEGVVIGGKGFYV